MVLANGIALAVVCIRESRSIELRFRAHRGDAAIFFRRIDGAGEQGIPGACRASRQRIGRTRFPNSQRGAHAMSDVSNIVPFPNADLVEWAAAPQVWA